MSKATLFQDDDSDKEELFLTTESEYAIKYDTWRGKEELHKLEQKYGPKALEEGYSVSSDSDDESDELPIVTEEVETQFLTTLSLLKSKDPRIYDPGYQFFNKEEGPKEKTTTSNSLSFANSDEDDDDDDGNIFKVEKAAPQPQDSLDLPKKSPKKNKKGLKQFLAGKSENNDDVDKDIEPLKALWSDPKLNEGEAFLRDYILNKRYLDDGDPGEVDGKLLDDEDLEADEEIVEEQGKFERAYNFRFQEPDEEYLKRYPRTMSAIRPKDDSRSRKRAEVRARKDEEKNRKMEEIARMKALKFKEIQDKIAKIKEVTGNQDLAFKDEDLEGDFDPEEHDKRMRELFSENYYEDEDVDQKKPVFPEIDEELEIENWENYENEMDNSQSIKEGQHCEDDDFNMDADYDPKTARLNLLEELQENMTKKRRNRKKKSKLAQILSQSKPKFVPMIDEKTYNQFMEEYYKIDCEDVIGGDLPTRFKYRDVVPNDFGLSIEEILLADDKELTQWVPLKKIVKHRQENVEKSEINTYRLKAADVSLKKKMLPSLFKELPDEPELVVPLEGGKKKKKKKKKSKKDDKADEEKEISNSNKDSSLDERNEVHDNNDDTKKRKNKTKNKILNSTITNETNDSLVKHKKSDIKHIKDDNIVNDIVAEGEDIEIKVESSEAKSNKKKKKHKKNQPENKIDCEDDISTSSKSSKTIDNKCSTDASIKVKVDVDIEKPSVNANDFKKPKSKNLKRKSDSNVNSETSKKRKRNNKSKDFKNKFNNKQSTDPLGNLSDERLKAYGLNPKKYRSFLKYKKY